MGNSKLITALVCTRNRGDSLACTIRSILNNDYDHFELIVVDQSDDQETAEAVAPFLHDGRLRYIHTDTQGVSRARNIGLGCARSEIVAVTDDDCEVSPDWIFRVATVFSNHADVAVLFYNVDAAPHDSRLGFIPTYLRQGDRLVTTVAEKCKARGIGAGMAVRRQEILDIGGFDEMLGPGAPFPACEEGDLAVRALLKGHHIYETDQIRIIHHGFRTYSEGRTLAHRNWVGIGAAYAKPLRSGHWRFVVVPLYEFFVVAAWPPIKDLLSLRLPRGLTRFSAFLQGFVRGWRCPVDSDTLLFHPEGRLKSDSRLMLDASAPCHLPQDVQNAEPDRL